MFESYHKLALEKHNDLRRLHSNTQALALDADLCVDASVRNCYKSVKRSDSIFCSQSNTEESEHVTFVGTFQTLFRIFGSFY